MILASLLTLFVCRAVLASAIVPPWQGPDEPVHFLLAQLLTTPDDRVSPARPKLEAQILESMARYRWWEPYGLRRPEPLPTSFVEASGITRTYLGVGLYSQPLYYGLGAAVLRAGPPANLEGAYWRLRVLSIALGVATLVLAWMGTQLLFGPTVALGATAIAAMHPQFLLAAISVNSDALAVLLGACTWWLVARVAQGHRPTQSLILLVVTVVAALLTKRNATPLAVVGGIIIVSAFLAPTTWRLTGRTVAHLGLLCRVTAALLFVAWTAGAAPFTTLAAFWHSALDLLGRFVAGMPFGGPLTELAGFWRRALVVNRGEVTLPLVVDYLRTSIDSTWLVAGWLRFPAPEPWLWVARLLTVVGLAGAADLVSRSPALRRPLSIAWLFVIAQAAAVVGLGFMTGEYPQGRYLFPVLAPATALLWLGLTQAVPAPLRPYAGPMLISILAVMDVTGVTAVLIPAYLPWG